MALHGLQNPWIETPLVESANLSKAARCTVLAITISKYYILNRRSRILLKLETLQPGGSFKSRGLGLMIKRRVEAAAKNADSNTDNVNLTSNGTTNGEHKSSSPKRIHIFTSSGGNAGLATVHAANLYHLPSTVVVPCSTKPHMLAKLRAAGAQSVVQVGATWRDADTHLREHVIPQAAKAGKNADGSEEVEALYVPPFDHPDIWEGHSFMVDEVAAELDRWGGRGGVPSAIVCSAGGGGLFAGIKYGVERQKGWTGKTKVVVMNTVGADAMAESIRQDQRVTLPGITSIATSLGAVQVAEVPFELGRKGRDDESVVSAVLTDAEAAMGCWRLADDERILVEPACGVSAALCYGGRLDKVLGRKVSKDEIVVIVVCGGANVSTSIVEEWRREYDSSEALAGDHAKDDSRTVPSAAIAAT